MEIIRARPADAAALSKIAFAAKAHWGYPLAWLEHWREKLTITDAYIRAHETFFARAEGRVAGFYALVATGPDRMDLDHLWVIPAAMGRGIGKTLFRHAAERARIAGASCLTIEADPNAELFYLRMGAIRAGTNVSEVEGRRRELPVLHFALQPGG